MIRLHGDPNSRAFRCVWMLEELGLPYQLVPTSFSNGETREAAFLRINPNGKVPVLIDDGDITVWESLAINCHLADRYDGGLAPMTPRERGEAWRWSFWAMGEFEGPIDAVARRGATLEPGWAAAPLGVLDTSLGGTPWLLGDRFSVADINVSVMFVRPLLAKEDLAPFANVEGWWKRLQARPAFECMRARSGR